MKDNRLVIRLSEKERGLVQELAALHDQKLATFCRRVLIDKVKEFTNINLK